MIDPMAGLAENYNGFLREIHQTAVSAGRDPGQIMLLAVSKTFPEEDIAELYQAGCRDFGENRIPELQEKASALPGDIRWHFIGQLQSNKVRKVVLLADVIHAVESVSLIERLDRIAGEEGRSPEFLLEVNVSGEASKSGCTPETLPELAAAAANCKYARWQGLMTMAPADAPEDLLRHVFGTLRDLRDGLADRFGRPLPVLSMGMSGDWQTAVQEGATILRIGSALFGRRVYA